MKRFLLVGLLGTTVATDATAQQPSLVAPNAAPMYGTAHVWLFNNYCHLSLADGVTPTGKFDYLEENGKKRRFADEAAALNYLYGLGWEAQPIGRDSREDQHYYLLKRRAQ